MQLARLFDEGIGVPEQDREEARRWYRQAAEHLKQSADHGDDYAERKLKELYEDHPDLLLNAASTLGRMTPPDDRDDTKTCADLIHRSSVDQSAQRSTTVAPAGQPSIPTAASATLGPDGKYRYQHKDGTPY
jgi:TPR repeat protein